MDRVQELSEILSHHRECVQSYKLNSAERFRRDLVESRRRWDIFRILEREYVRRTKPPLRLFDAVARYGKEYRLVISLHENLGGAMRRLSEYVVVAKIVRGSDPKPVWERRMLVCRGTTLDFIMVRFLPNRAISWQKTRHGFKCRVDFSRWYWLLYSCVWETGVRISWSEKLSFWYRWVLLHYPERLLLLWPQLYHQISSIPLLLNIIAEYL